MTKMIIESEELENVINDVEGIISCLCSEEVAFKEETSLPVMKVKLNGLKALIVLMKSHGVKKVR